MQDIFGLFIKDCNPVDENGSSVPRQKPDFPYSSDSAALIGSPGVGKSILFFLAALYQAQTSKIVYYRSTQSEITVSMFVMTPENDGTVRIWFSRNVDKEVEGLSYIHKFLGYNFNIDLRKFYSFVDGPKHGDIANTLVGTYDYFCTSGGMPRYSSEEKDKRLWILDGWTRNESIEWLSFMGETRAAANEIYSVCGGNVREMAECCKGDLDGVRNNLSIAVTELGAGEIQLFVQSTLRVDKSRDRLRTMFRSRKLEIGAVKAMRAVQYVDSDYVLNQLIFKLDVETVYNFYILA